jgi:hypothetical protein
MFLTRQNLDKFVCRHFRCENSINVNSICLNFLSQSMTMYVDVFQYNVEFENFFFFRMRSVWQLSHRMWSVFIESNHIISKKRLYHITFLTIRVNVNNSVSMLEMMTIVYFAVFQFMRSSYNWNKYSSKLLQITSSSANVASLTQSRMFVDRLSKYSIVRFLISYR